MAPPMGPREAGYFCLFRGPRLQPWTEVITAWRYMVRVTVFMNCNTGRKESSPSTIEGLTCAPIL